MCVSLETLSANNLINLILLSPSTLKDENILKSTVKNLDAKRILFCVIPNQMIFFFIENYACYNHGVSQDHEAAQVKNNFKPTGGQRSMCTFGSIEVLQR